MQISVRYRDVAVRAADDLTIGQPLFLSVKA